MQHITTARKHSHYTCCPMAACPQLSQQSLSCHCMLMTLLTRYRMPGGMLVYWCVGRKLCIGPLSSRRLRHECTGNMLSCRSNSSGHCWQPGQGQCFCACILYIALPVPYMAYHQHRLCSYAVWCICVCANSYCARGICIAHGIYIVMTKHS